MIVVERSALPRAKSCREGIIFLLIRIDTAGDERNSRYVSMRRLDKSAECVSERVSGLGTRVRKRSRARVNDTRRCEHTLHSSRENFATASWIEVVVLSESLFSRCSSKRILELRSMDRLFLRQIIYKWSIHVRGCYSGKGKNNKYY